MNYLWTEPKFIVSILENADIKDVKSNLGAFIANNFYENILSSYYIEDNLMYVLTLLLKSEINKLNKPNEFDKFLEETACGVLLTELKRKNDIQNFFKTIISSVIENLELYNSNRKINFSVKKYQEEYLKNQQLQNEKQKDKKKKKMIHIKKLIVFRFWV